MLDGAEGDDGDICLSDLVESKNKKFSYTYDFGDDWKHEIKIEKTLPVESKAKSPLHRRGKGMSARGLWRRIR